MTAQALAAAAFAAESKLEDIDEQVHEGRLFAAANKGPSKVYWLKSSLLAKVDSGEAAPSTPETPGAPFKPMQRTHARANWNVTRDSKV